jgi:surface polysaccharide O-acyltransferase-like enzyme
VTERTSGSDLFLEVTVTSPYAGITTEEFVRVIGQITYTSVPIFLTASGY